MRAGPRDRYRLDRLIAAGGSAEVWRGLDIELGRPVAIKLLHAHLVPDETSRDRLEQEALAAAGLSHPGIVAIYDLIRVDDRPAIVLELVEGETLAARLAREARIRPAEAASIAAEVADALQHAHDRGVLHRDVKPGNILLDARGRPKLADFGIARLLDERRERITAADAIPGTLHYLAPERLVGGDVGPAADVYGLGVVLYEMLVGRPPFDPPNPILLIEAQRAPPPPLPDVPRELAAIAFAALRVDAGARPSTAGAMGDALRAWVRGDVFVAPTKSEATTVVDVSRTRDTDSVGESQGARAKRGHWALWIVPPAALAAAALLAGALVLAPGSEAPTSSPASVQPATPTLATATSPPAAETAPPADPLTSAHGRFSDLVLSGERAGAIGEDAAKDLLDAADRVLERAADGDRRQVIDALSRLRRTIDELERDGDISADVADQLREAAEAMAVAAA